MHKNVEKQGFDGQKSAWGVIFLKKNRKNCAFDKRKFTFHPRIKVDFSHPICYNNRMNISFVGGAYESIREIFKIRGISHYVK